jgi:hypothetical protein
MMWTSKRRDKPLRLDLSRNTAARYYQNVLAVIVVGAFYTNVPLYLYEKSGSSGDPPKYWVIVLAVMTVPFLWERVLSWNLQKLPILGWCFTYIWISIIWFFPSSQSEVAWQVLKYHFQAVIVLFLMLIVFSSRSAVVWAGKALTVAVLFGCVLNMYEVFNPLAFSDNAGRSAGLYANPNLAAEALVLGMILSLATIPHRYRFAFMLIAGVGILTTFSRAGIVVWCLAVAGTVLGGMVRFKNFIVSISIAALVMVLIVVPQWDQARQFLKSTGVLNVNVEGRVNWFMNPSASSDSSSLERAYIAQLAWQKFSEHPIFGSGTGASREGWDGVANNGTHNMYLALMVDHGLLGLLVLPLLLLSVMWAARGESKYIGRIFGLSVVLLAFASHKILDMPQTFTLFALMAAMAATSHTAVTPAVHRRIVSGLVSTARLPAM